MAKNAKVAYYCMEFGIEGLPFGGGLGVLAGDYIKSCADLGLPVVGVTLLYSRGTFRQRIKDGRQVPWYDRFDPSGKMHYRGNHVTVPIENRGVYLNAFEYNYVGETGHVVPILFVDVDVDHQDRAWGDDICKVLYPRKHPWYKLAQEQVLGTGGVKTLDTLGYKEIKVHHLNEGHAALAGPELLKRYGSIEEARNHIVFTTHTVLPAGIDRFSRELAEKVLGEESASYILNLIGSDELNMAKLAMALSGESFGVSPLHAKVSRSLFKDFPYIDRLYSIDNGVHLQTWSSPEVQKLFDKLTDRKWRIHPESLEKILEVPEEEVLRVHERSRERLGKFLKGDARVIGNSEKSYDPEKLTIGYAKRFTDYKQATLIFNDIDMLGKLGGDIQLVFSGKAHPGDEGGNKAISEVLMYMKELSGQVAIWYIEDYDMSIAKQMVRGVDLWLNTPMVLLEASGSSGMKAASNLIPQLSTLDGWYILQEPAEGYSLQKGLIEGVTGWGIGKPPTESDFSILLNGHDSDVKRYEKRRSDAEDLYGKLGEIAVPLFKRDKKGWAKVMRGSTAHNVPWVNTHRMAKQYFEQAYHIPLEELVLI